MSIIADLSFNETVEPVDNLVGGLSLIGDYHEIFPTGGPHARPLPLPFPIHPPVDVHPPVVIHPRPRPRPRPGHLPYEIIAY
jgi:hypothetical protein